MPYNSYFNRKFGLDEQFLSDPSSIEEYYESQRLDSPLSSPQAAARSVGTRELNFEEPSMYNFESEGLGAKKMTTEGKFGLISQGLGAGFDIFEGASQGSVKEAAQLSSAGGDVRFAGPEAIDKEAYLESIKGLGGEKGGKIGSGIGAGVGVGVAALTYGAAAPLIPAFAKAGKAIGKAIGGESGERTAEEEYGEYLRSVQSRERRHEAFKQQQSESVARLKDIYSRGNSMYSAGYSNYT